MKSSSKSLYRLIFSSTLSSIILSSFISCEKVEEKYLYNKYDSDYGLVLALATETCQEESKFFIQASKRSAFSSYFEEDTYYKVSIQKANGASYSDFIKISNIDSDSMQINYFDSQNPASDSKSITFTSAQNDNLITAIANGACDTRDDYQFSASGLDSSSALNFSDSRIDGDDDSYTKITDAFKAQMSIPLPFILWNKQRTTITKTSGNDANDAENDSYTITEITESSCEGDSKCAQAESTYNWAFGAGTISVDPNAYNDNSTSSEIITVN